MRKAGLLLPLLFWSAAPAWADGGPEQAAVAMVPAGPQVRIRQQLRAHSVEVRRLEQEVSAQESSSIQAAQRLQEQDDQIARLQRQLEAIDKAPRGAMAAH
jgi:hypothetical protein